MAELRPSEFSEESSSERPTADAGLSASSWASYDSKSFSSAPNYDPSADGFASNQILLSNLGLATSDMSNTGSTSARDDKGNERGIDNVPGTSAELESPGKTKGLQSEIGSPGTSKATAPLEQPGTSKPGPPPSADVLIDPLATPPMRGGQSPFRGFNPHMLGD
jgi:hypothetical protein